MTNTARCWRCHALVLPGTVHEHEGLTYTAIPSHEVEDKYQRFFRVVCDQYDRWIAP